MEQFEVLRSGAHPANNQQCKHYWDLSDDRVADIKATVFDECSLANMLL